MASTFSTNLKIELQTTGENSGTWGTITNTNLGTALEQAIVGYGNPSYASDANLTLTYTDTNAAQTARALVLNVTSAVSLTGTRELVVPTIQKQYIVQNNTTGSQSITVKTSGGTGVTVPNGRKAHLYVNGTDVIYMDDYVDINGGAIDGTPIGANSASTGAFTTLAASGNVTLSGGTANGVLYLNGSKVATSGSALTFDGTIFRSTQLNIGTAPNANSRPWALNGFGYISGASGNGIEMFNSSTSTYGYWTFESDNRFSFNAIGGHSWTAGGAEKMRVTGTVFSTDSSINVGIGTASPTSKLDLVGIMQWQATAGTVLGKLTYSGGEPVVLANTGLGLQFFTNNAFAAKIDSSGNLGIGTASPLNKLDVRAASDVIANYQTIQAFSTDSAAIDKGAGLALGGYYSGTSSIAMFGSLVGRKENNTAGNFSGYLAFGTNNNATGVTEKMRLDSSGNLGLGVTPSAWSLATAAQVGFGAALSSRSAGSTASDMTHAAYWNGTNWLYQSTSVGAARYQMTGANAGSTHAWFVSAGGTAGNTISFTQAMTLDASGNLGVGTTSPADTNSFGRALDIRSSTGAAAYFRDSDDATKYGVAGFFGADSNAYYGSWGTGTGVLFYSAGSERGRFTSSGNFCIGSSEPGNAGSLNLSVGNPGVTSGGLQLWSTTTGTHYIQFGDSASGGAPYSGAVGYNHSDNALVFWTNQSEKGRFTAGGDLLVGTSSSSASANAGAKIYPAGTMRCVNADSTNSTENWSMYSTGAANYRFYVGWGGTVYATNTTISGISDQRYKENIRDLDVGLDAILALKPRKFDWKEGKGKDIKGDRGFIAQEFEQVFPDLVDKWKDPAPEGEEPYKSVRQDLIPVLVKAIQELKTELDAAKVKIAALEAK